MGWAMEGTGRVDFRDLDGACRAILNMATIAGSEWGVLDMQAAMERQRIDLMLPACPGRWRIYPRTDNNGFGVYADDGNRSGGGGATEGREEFEAMAPFIKNGVINVSSERCGSQRWIFENGLMTVLVPATAQVWVPQEAEGVDAVLVLIEEGIRSGRAPALVGMSNEAMQQLAALFRGEK